MAVRQERRRFNPEAAAKSIYTEPVRYEGRKGTEEINGDKMASIDAAGNKGDETRSLDAIVDDGGCIDNGKMLSRWLVTK
ncbi:hypothetical protein ANO11243_082110 [Dothideomycetidae sp. 11243]|nr:hypothetical protein ANO11243_082110 [fungal sp. No.11243]